MDGRRQSKTVNLSFLLQIETERVAYSGRYDDREDFAVVVQPFLRNSIMPLNDGRPDVTYFSEDCFHFSERGHADMAVAMWNNMLEPVGEKQTYNNFTGGRDRIRCPTEVRNSYIYRIDLKSLHSPGQAPDFLWLATVLAASALLLGWALTWLMLTCRAKRKKRSMTFATTVEMKASLF
uniref:Uncharacterized protein n=1 Tax=Hippocampus comes TaxID=109280 RepID=A0A3Q2YFL4_HIPCM